MKKVIFITLILLYANVTHAAVSSGSAAPDFTLTDAEGKKHSLSDYQGKTVVLEWVNPDCPFVKKHYDTGNMQKLQKEYTAKDVIWLSIASSARGKQGHYSANEWKKLTVDKGASPTAVLLDPDGKVGRLYGAKTTPHMYIINPEGDLMYQGAIDSIASTDRGDVGKAENYVSGALTRVLAGQKPGLESTKAYGCSIKYA